MRRRSACTGRTRPASGRLSDRCSRGASYHHAQSLAGEDEIFLFGLCHRPSRNRVICTEVQGLYRGLPPIHTPPNNPPPAVRTLR